MPHKQKTFICHSSLDHEFVSKLYNKMKMDGIEVWIDDWEIKVGDSIRQKIEAGITESCFFVIVFSSNSITSNWVNSELDAAYAMQMNNKGIKILPALLSIEEAKMPPLFSGIYAAKFKDNNVEINEYEKLIQPIKEKYKEDYIKQHQDIFFADVSHIDKILNSSAPTRNEIKFVLELLKKEDYKNYFFSKVKNDIWFNILKQEEFFNPDSSPPVKESEDQTHYSFPLWSVLPYLENISKIATDDKLINDLLIIIDDVSKYNASTVGGRLNNNITWWHFVKILLNLPPKKITAFLNEKKIDFGRHWLRVWIASRFDNTLPASDILTKMLPKFLENDKDSIQISEDIIKETTAIKREDIASSDNNQEVSSETRTIVDSYWLVGGIGRNVEKIGKLCSEKVIYDLANKLKMINEHNDEHKSVDYSYIWFKFLNSDPGPGFYEPKVIFTIFLRDIILSKCKTDKKIGREVLLRVLGDDYKSSVFKRLALYVVDSIWDEYDELFWQFLDENNDALSDPHYEVELYKIFQNHILDFSEEEKDKVRKIIDKGSAYKQAEPSYQNHWKLKWLSALEKEKQFKNDYEKMIKTTGIQKIESPLEPVTMIKYGPGNSPIDYQNILKMENLAIVSFLNEFQGNDIFSGPTVEGLAEELKKAAMIKPDKFVNDLELFINCKYIHICSILEGLRQAWKEKKAFEWRKLLDFILKYLKEKDFYREAKKNQREDYLKTHVWVVNTIADLIQDGTRRDDWAFDESLFDNAVEIIDLIISKLSIKKGEHSYKDAVTHALNTSWGYVIKALILLFLRINRVADKKGSNKDLRWKEKYNSLLDKKIEESYTLFGLYMGNFAFLDTEWVEQTTQKLKTMQREDDVCWLSFVDGYLFAPEVYQNLYDLMKNNQHYLKALDVNFKNENTNERLIQHIGMGYLNGKESLDGIDSLFRKLLDDCKYEQMKEVVIFLWSRGEYLMRQPDKDKEIIERIMKFWEWAFINKCTIESKIGVENNSKFLSNLSRLTVVLDEIDEIRFEWLMHLAPFVQQDFNYSFFVEYLDRFDDEMSIKKVGKIFIKMLSGLKTFPSYKDQLVRSIVEKVARRGEKEDAKEICNILGSRFGYYELKDIYDDIN